MIEILREAAAEVQKAVGPMSDTKEAGGIVFNGTGSVLDASILSLEGISIVACSNKELYRDVSRLLRDGKN